jgi:type II secretory pathway component PulF
VGEESGDLPSALHKAARLYERELEGVLRRATTLLEPLLILVLGLFVAFVVFAMMLPILQMDLGMG